MDDFRYSVPTSLEEALALHGQDAGHTRYLAGGTDLFLALERKPQGTRQVVDLKGVPGLASIAGPPGDGCRLGALCPMAMVERHPAIRRRYAALAEAASVVGGPPIRNRATLGGNLCNASPAADTAPPLLVLAAEVEVRGATGARKQPLTALWRAPGQTTLGPGEILTAVSLPPLPTASGSAFERLTRTAMDIALVSVAARVTLDGSGCFESAAIALGAVGPTPILVPGAETELRGETCSENVLARVTELARSAASPIDDVRASAAYRRDMVGVLATRALRRAFEAAQRAAREAQ